MVLWGLPVYFESFFAALFLPIVAKPLGLPKGLTLTQTFLKWLCWCLFAKSMGSGALRKGGRGKEEGCKKGGADACEGVVHAGVSCWGMCWGGAC